MRDLPSALGVLLGLALVVYGAASLTGNWLHTPPWWQREATDAEIMDYLLQRRREGRGLETDPARQIRAFIWRPRDNREAWSGGVIAAGVLVAGVAAWPRRR